MQFFPVRAITIVVLLGFMVVGAIVVAVARGPGPHRVAATAGVIFFLSAAAASAVTLLVASGGFDSCWTF